MSMTSFVNVNFDMKNPIKLFVGERSKTTFDSGCKMFDIILRDHFHFDAIKFQNFYTAYLTIKARDKNSGEWKILLNRHRLMESVHGETGANDSFTLTRTMMLEPAMTSVIQLRFILQQPSVNWRDFGLEDLKLRIMNPDLAVDRLLQDFSKRCERTRKGHFEKLPPVDDLSSRLQRLWAICHEASKCVPDDDVTSGGGGGGSGAFEAETLA